MNSPIISFNAVSKVFSRKGESVTALDNINLTIQQGEIFGVIGASGAGKSTLLRLINSLETADRGEVLINGVSLQGLSGRERSQAKKDIGMIFQHFNLLNSRTVFHNVAIPLILQRRSKQEIRERVRELLAFVNLSDKAQSYPDELSGGKNSGWVLPGHWLPIRRCCCVMKRPRRSIRIPRFRFYCYCRKLTAAMGSRLC